MSKLFLVTLEPLESRYTSQWKNWFKEEFPSAIEIDGSPQRSSTDSKSFLNFNTTNVWKSEQIIKIAAAFDIGLVRPGDAFLFYDAWHYGAQAVKYMSLLNKVPVRIFGMWHAGSYDKHDLVASSGGGPFFKDFERSLYSCYDVNFFATHFHARMFCDGLNLRGDAVAVTGFPYKFDHLDPYKNMPKRNQVVFPHRLSSEKQPEIAKKIASRLKRYNIDMIFCQERKLSKHEYHMILGQSKVVFSANLQETWGIGTFEGLYVGALPLVPDRLSYSEMYDPMFKYNGRFFSDELHGNPEFEYGAIENVTNYIVDMVHNYDQYSVSALRNLTYLQKKFCSFSFIKSCLETYGI
jgi:hypothetical protein